MHNFIIRLHKTKYIRHQLVLHYIYLVSLYYLPDQATPFTPITVSYHLELQIAMTLYWYYHFLTRKQLRNMICLAWYESDTLGEN